MKTAGVCITPRLIFQEVWVRSEEENLGGKQIDGKE
jgi:hypothetical protein